MFNPVNKFLKMFCRKMCNYAWRLPKTKTQQNKIFWSARIARDASAIKKVMRVGRLPPFLTSTYYYELTLLDTTSFVYIHIILMPAGISHKKQLDMSLMANYKTYNWFFFVFSWPMVPDNRNVVRYLISTTCYFNETGALESKFTNINLFGEKIWEWKLKRQGVYYCDCYKIHSHKLRFEKTMTNPN